MYGWTIETVSGLFILTHNQMNIGANLAVLQGGLPTQTRYVFLTAEEMLKFLGDKLKATTPQENSREGGK